MDPAPLFSRGLRAAAALATVTVALPALAWGPQGHRVTGALADQLLAGTPTAKKVRQVLGANLQQAAAWADCARAVELKKGVWVYTLPGTHPDCRPFENPASEHALIDYVQRNASRCGGFASSAVCRHKGYHFVDLPIQHPHYDPASPGTAPSDLVQAIDAAIVVLQGGKSPAPFDIRGQREALRLLAHFIGDLHQPLHVGAIYLDDDGHPVDPADAADARAHGNAGGNQITLENAKLHALWDDVPDKTAKAVLAAPALAQARRVDKPTGPLAGWAALWAGESATVAAQAYAGLTIGAKHVGLGGAEWPATASEPAYRDERATAQQLQLVRGGARLAQVLRAIWP